MRALSNAEENEALRVRIPLQRFGTVVDPADLFVAKKQAMAIAFKHTVEARSGGRISEVRERVVGHIGPPFRLAVVQHGSEGQEVPRTAPRSFPSLYHLVSLISPPKKWADILWASSTITRSQSAWSSRSFARTSSFRQPGRTGLPDLTPLRHAMKPNSLKTRTVARN
ncbi:MAG: hypothetical protein HY713_04310 [candidate division NC10 bacterium]|nr:hypothetical protein [candidate division NC10 bacterium]